MLRVTAMIRPHKLEEVKTAVTALGVNGITVSDVRGTGDHPETSSYFAGQEILIALPIRAKIEVCILDELREKVTDAIMAAAYTGEPGDGKIFVEALYEAVRIRTLERGRDVL